MLRTLFWSFKKSSRLRKIARKLTPQPDVGESFVRAFAEGGFEAFGPRMEQIEEGKKELFALMRQDPVVNKVLQDYGVSDDELDKIYNKLIRNGAGIFKNGHWVPASSLAYGQTLDYVLKHRNEGHEQFEKICYRLWQYFSNNETGDIEE